MRSEMKRKTGSGCEIIGQGNMRFDPGNRKGVMVEKTVKAGKESEMNGEEHQVRRGEKGGGWNGIGIEWEDIDGIRQEKKVHEMITQTSQEKGDDGWIGKEKTRQDWFRKSRKICSERGSEGQ